MYILGINAYHSDASAALIKDGELIAAAEEERFNRIKHCAGFPTAAIQYCLKAGGITLRQVDHIGISRDPSAHLHKKILFAMSRLSDLRGKIADRLANAARVRDIKSELLREFALSASDVNAGFHNVEHHKAHMASCFLISPFESAAILSIDSFGDFISTMWGFGENAKMEVYDQIEYPHSMGNVYTATTQFLGFPHFGDEGKVMGLAPYGKPRYIEQFRDIVQTEEDGRFKLNLDYFRHHKEGVDTTWDQGSPVVSALYSDKFAEALGPVRERGSEITERHQDIAASLQLRLEEVAKHLLQHLQRKTGSKRLCLSGGVAYNSVMNGKILLHTRFEEIYIQPAAGDSGTAIGACYYIWNVLLGKPRSFVMEHAYTGPGFSNDEVLAAIRKQEIPARLLSDEELIAAGAQAIADGKIVGWFQGRMEFGPRALGNRSILVDPRRGDMKDILNARIKKREHFRPFAPSILEERMAEYFEQTHPAPTMLMVYQIKQDKRTSIPAVTHVDGSGRLQSVTRRANPRYYDLISQFDKLTGVPIVLNTSFNEDEPIVCTPDEAIQCFSRTKMDVLFLGNYVLER